MPFNVNEFKSEINRSGGFSYTSDFEVIVLPPLLMYPLNNANIPSSLRYRIEAIELPGRTTSPIEFRTYGTPYKMAGAIGYLDVTMNVILSSDHREREFFQRWFDLTSGRHRRGDISPGDSGFDIGYYDDYKSRVIISQYAEAGNKVKETILVDSFPIGIGSISNSWSAKEISKLPVTISYRYFEEVR